MTKHRGFEHLTLLVFKINKLNLKCVKLKVEFKIIYSSWNNFDSLEAKMNEAKYFIQSTLSTPLVSLLT
jgi:hypothetical protein